MALSRWQRISQIFEAAVELPPEQRARFVREACRGDADMEFEVVRLLAADERAGSFLEGPAVSTLSPVTAARPDTPAPFLAVGTVAAGRFQVVRFIGQGGMGQVYEALDLELKSRIALKLIRPDIASDSRMLSRFRREVQLTRMITHPNVCRTFDIERHQPPATGEPSNEARNDLVFLTMELLEGETLAALLRREGRLTPVQTLPLVLQMINALAAAHSVAVIHRDFKPSNVLLVQGNAAAKTCGPRSEESRAGSSGSKSAGSEIDVHVVRVVVTDFGLAVAAEAGASGPVTTDSLTKSLTGDQALMGTLVYMAPEQFERGEASVASDIYSLGLVMFEMMTGQRPFADDIPFAEATKRLKQAAPSASGIAAGIDPTWDAAISRCLALHPEDRFETVQQLREALTHPRATITKSISPHRPVNVVRNAEQVTETGREATYPFSRRKIAVTVGIVVFIVSLSTLAFRHYLRRHTPIHFAERDWILVTDFTNETGEKLFDRVVRDLAVQSLSQSSYVNIVPRLSAFEAAKRTGLKEVDSIDERLGRELCLRENYRALLTGNIYKNKSRYTIAIRVEVPGQDWISISDTESIESSDELFGGIDRLTGRIRRNLGESLSKIQINTKPLAQVSTPSLEALQRYSTAVDLCGAREYTRCINLANDAIQRDPNFAMAHLLLAQAYEKTGDEDHSQAQYELAATSTQGLAEREKRLIQAAYFLSKGLNQKSADEYQHLLDIYPDDVESLRGFAEASFWAGHSEKAIFSLRRAVQLSPHDVTGYDALITFLVRTSQFEAAGEAYQTAQRQGLDTPNLRFLAGLTAWGRDDLATAERYISSLKTEESDYWKVMNSIYAGKLFAYRGQMQEALRVFRTGLAFIRSLGWNNWVPAFDYQIARAELARGRGNIAQRQVREYVGEAKKIPTPGNLQRAGRLLVQIGDLRQAKECLRLIEKQLATAPDPFSQMERSTLSGDIDLALGREQSAIQKQQEAMGYVDSFEPMLSLGEACEGARNWTCAEQAYLKYIAQKGELLRDDATEEWLTAHLRLARAFDQSGDEIQASLYYQKLRSLLSDADLDIPIVRTSHLHETSTQSN